MASSAFSDWLCVVLETAGVDGEVYGGYISGSLAAMTGSPREDVEETVQDILSGCLEEEEEKCKQLCVEIVGEWMTRETERLAAEAKEEEDKEKDESMGVPVSNSSRGERDKKRDDPVALIGGLSVSDKKRLVAQYGDLSNDEDELYPPFNMYDREDDPGGGGGSRYCHHSRNHAPNMAEVFENMNARLVSQAEREKKEKEKAAHEVKVERDRNNREAQKQKGLDRKEKEKKRTQKHERRR
ncbi:Coiled-coil domain-containing protein 43 [Geodia barretti]|uniref:Coiled-coil domain-containing protein 43 n=1 Tax=Geodia barretti TaxID=519541 RepID=A0AA35WQJ6_GEOBA|nr:Coiled-coil domain-containing protein 43 [Geodia barretti]